MKQFNTKSVQLKNDKSDQQKHTKVWIKIDKKNLHFSIKVLKH
jgi:uncharacterized protein with von Willebrand factor type A (vWA) domain